MASRQLPQKLAHERVLVLVKALPHPGRNHGETVCCAGVTLNGEWRRQYPIRFRQMENQFQRWQWIEYDYILPKGDKRVESRHVQDNTVRVGTKMPVAERAPFLDRIVMPSTAEAAVKGMSLALIRPLSTRFYWVRKSLEQVEAERRANEAAARQFSLFDQEIATLQPCPFEFRFDYKSEDGKPHTAKCGDWETSAMFFRFEKEYGEARALELMKNTFGQEYPAKGMAFAMGTHSQYPDVWLLVGVLRLDVVSQFSMSL